MFRFEFGSKVDQGTNSAPTLDPFGSGSEVCLDLDFEPMLICMQIWLRDLSLDSDLSPDQDLDPLLNWIRFWLLSLSGSGFGSKVDLCKDLSPTLARIRVL